MNFLEQLVAEWYQYEGYLVRTNIRFGRNPNGRGGNVGEMDVIAYEPTRQDFIHIETSGDFMSWPERKRRFEKKFSDARKYYQDVFSFKQTNMRPRQIAIVGHNKTPSSNRIAWRSSAPNNSPWGSLEIEVVHIPKFIQRINEQLKNKNPVEEAVPETYPLLRAIQYGVFYTNSIL
jgi:hypothetical protein